MATKHRLEVQQFWIMMHGAPAVSVSVKAITGNSAKQDWHGDMSYLYDYKIKEIGLIGNASNGSRYAFGYISNDERPPDHEIAEWEKLFKRLDLKLRTDVSQLDLKYIDLPSMPLFTSPF